MSSPEPITAIVRPPYFKAVSCATVSIPRAKPETIVILFLTSSFTNSSVNLFPLDVISLDPTTATAFLSDSFSLPNIYKLLFIINKHVIASRAKQSYIF